MFVSRPLAAGTRGVLAFLLGGLALLVAVLPISPQPAPPPAVALAVPTPTFTPTPTSVRPPPVPDIDKTVNGQQGPIAVIVGESVTYRWVVTNAGDRPFHATVDDDVHDGLDGKCDFVDAGQTCEQSAVVALLTPGIVTNTSTVEAIGIPPFPGPGGIHVFDGDSVTVKVLAEPGVGGFVEIPQVARSVDAEVTQTGSSSRSGAVVLFGAGTAALAVALALWALRRAMTS